MRQVTFGPIGERVARNLPPALTQEQVHQKLAEYGRSNVVVDTAIAATTAEQQEVLPTQMA